MNALTKLLIDDLEGKLYKKASASIEDRIYRIFNRLAYKNHSVYNTLFSKYLNENYTVNVVFKDEARREGITLNTITFEAKVDRQTAPFEIIIPFTYKGVTYEVRLNKKITNDDLKKDAIKLIYSISLVSEDKSDSWILFSDSGTEINTVGNINLDPGKGINKCFDTIYKKHLFKIFAEQQKKFNENIEEYNKILENIFDDESLKPLLDEIDEKKEELKLIIDARIDMDNRGAEKRYSEVNEETTSETSGTTETTTKRKITKYVYEIDGATYKFDSFDELKNKLTNIIEEKTNEIDVDHYEFKNQYIIVVQERFNQIFSQYADGKIFIDYNSHIQLMGLLSDGGVSVTAPGSIYTSNIPEMNDFLKEYRDVQGFYKLYNKESIDATLNGWIKSQMEKLFSDLQFPELQLPEFSNFFEDEKDFTEENFSNIGISIGKYKKIYEQDMEDLHLDPSVEYTKPNFETNLGSINTKKQENFLKYEDDLRKITSLRNTVKARIDVAEASIREAFRADYRFNRGAGGLSPIDMSAPLQIEKVKQDSGKLRDGIVFEEWTKKTDEIKKQIKEILDNIDEKYFIDDGFNKKEYIEDFMEELERSKKNEESIFKQNIPDSVYKEILGTSLFTSHMIQNQPYKADDGFLDKNIKSLNNKMYDFSITKSTRRDILKNIFKSAGDEGKLNTADVRKFQSWMYDSEATAPFSIIYRQMEVKIQMSIEKNASSSSLYFFIGNLIDFEIQIIKNGSKTFFRIPLLETIINNNNDSNLFKDLEKLGVTDPKFYSGDGSKATKNKEFIDALKSSEDGKVKVSMSFMPILTATGEGRNTDFYRAAIAMGGNQTIIENLSFEYTKSSTENLEYAKRKSLDSDFYKNLSKQLDEKLGGFIIQSSLIGLSNGSYNGLNEAEKEKYKKNRQALFRSHGNTQERIDKQLDEYKTQNTKTSAIFVTQAIDELNGSKAEEKIFIKALKSLKNQDTTNYNEIIKEITVIDSENQKKGTKTNYTYMVTTAVERVSDRPPLQAINGFKQGFIFDQDLYDIYRANNIDVDSKKVNSVLQIDIDTHGIWSVTPISNHSFGNMEVGTAIIRLGDGEITETAFPKNPFFDGMLLSSSEEKGLGNPFVQESDDLKFGNQDLFRTNAFDPEKVSEVKYQDLKIGVDYGDLTPEEQLKRSAFQGYAPRITRDVFGDNLDNSVSLKNNVKVVYKKPDETFVEKITSGEGKNYFDEQNNQGRFKMGVGEYVNAPGGIYFIEYKPFVEFNSVADIRFDLYEGEYFNQIREKLKKRYYPIFDDIILSKNNINKTMTLINDIDHAMYEAHKSSDILFESPRGSSKIYMPLEEAKYYSYIYEYTTEASYLLKQVRSKLFEKISDSPYSDITRGLSVIDAQIEALTGKNYGTLNIVLEDSSKIYFADRPSIGLSEDLLTIKENSLSKIIYDNLEVNRKKGNTYSVLNLINVFEEKPMIEKVEINDLSKKQTLAYFQKLADCESELRYVFEEKIKDKTLTSELSRVEMKKLIDFYYDKHKIKLEREFDSMDGSEARVKALVEYASDKGITMNFDDGKKVAILISRGLLVSAFEGDENKLIGFVETGNRRYQIEGLDGKNILYNFYNSNNLNYRIKTLDGYNKWMKANQLEVDKIKLAILFLEEKIIRDNGFKQFLNTGEVSFDESKIAKGDFGENFSTLLKAFDEIEEIIDEISKVFDNPSFIDRLKIDLGYRHDKTKVYEYITLIVKDLKNESRLEFAKQVTRMLAELVYTSNESKKSEQAFKRLKDILQQINIEDSLRFDSAGRRSVLNVNDSSELNKIKNEFVEKLKKLESDEFKFENFKLNSKQIKDIDSSSVKKLFLTHLNKLFSTDNANKELGTLVALFYVLDPGFNTAELSASWSRKNEEITFFEPEKGRRMQDHDRIDNKRKKALKNSKLTFKGNKPSLGILIDSGASKIHLEDSSVIIWKFLFQELKEKVNNLSDDIIKYSVLANRISTVDLDDINAKKFIDIIILNLILENDSLLKEYLVIDISDKENPKISLKGEKTILLDVTRNQKNTINKVISEGNISGRSEILMQIGNVEDQFKGTRLSGILIDDTVSDRFVTSILQKIKFNTDTSDLLAKYNKVITEWGSFWDWSKSNKSAVVKEFSQLKKNLDPLIELQRLCIETGDEAGAKLIYDNTFLRMKQFLTIQEGEGAEKAISNILKVFGFVGSAYVYSELDRASVGKVLDQKLNILKEQYLKIKRNANRLIILGEKTSHHDVIFKDEYLNNSKIINYETDGSKTESGSVLDRAGVGNKRTLSAAELLSLDANRNNKEIFKLLLGEDVKIYDLMSSSSKKVETIAELFEVLENNSRFLENLDMIDSAEDLLSLRYQFFDQFEITKLIQDRIIYRGLATNIDKVIIEDFAAGKPGTGMSGKPVEGILRKDISVMTDSQFEDFIRLNMIPEEAEGVIASIHQFLKASLPTTAYSRGMMLFLIGREILLEGLVGITYWRILGQFLADIGLPFLQNFLYRLNLTTIINPEVSAKTKRNWFRKDNLNRVKRTLEQLRSKPTLSDIDRKEMEKLERLINDVESTRVNLGSGSAVHKERTTGFRGKVQQFRDAYRTKVILQAESIAKSVADLNMLQKTIYRIIGVGAGIKAVTPDLMASGLAYLFRGLGRVFIYAGVVLSAIGVYKNATTRDPKNGIDFGMACIPLLHKSLGSLQNLNYSDEDWKNKDVVIGGGDEIIFGSNKELKLDDSTCNKTARGLYSQLISELLTNLNEKNKDQYKTCIINYIDQLKSIIDTAARAEATEKSTVGQFTYNTFGFTPEAVINGIASSWNTISYFKTEDPESWWEWLWKGTANFFVFIGNLIVGGLISIGSIASIDLFLSGLGDSEYFSFAPADTKYSLKASRKIGDMLDDFESDFLTMIDSLEFIKLSDHERSEVFTSQNKGDAPGVNMPTANNGKKDCIEKIKEKLKDNKTKNEFLKKVDRKTYSQIINMTQINDYIKKYLENNSDPFNICSLV